MERALKRALAMALFTLAGSASAADGELSEAFELDRLVIVTSARSCRLFDVYLALSYEQQRRGLMHVRELPMTSGMWFVYDGEARRSMWMKNTYIPLDILFVRSDGAIVNIAKDTEPQSLRSIASAAPARFVLELNAGATDAFLIDENSLVIWEETQDADD
jgi:uncharacterized membrane protein (UPF0127 family)